MNRCQKIIKDDIYFEIQMLFWLSHIKINLCLIKKLISNQNITYPIYKRHLDIKLVT